MEPGKKLKIHAKLGFNSMETAEMVTMMNKLLANYHIFSQKLRNYHWNIKGQDFFNLHKKFKDLYAKSSFNIDEIAERIRVFGKTPMSTLGEYLEIMESFMINVIDAAGNVGDVASTDMINAMLRNLEKEHWMLSSWLNYSKKT